ncbi:MAG: hypothetical protein KDA61_19010, partial [Planctomycetales bacterium]|nr:hypothetical protein [Planctomycetales bacterium]
MRFELDDFANRWLPHPEGDVDLCVMPIAPLILESNKQGQELFFVPLTRDLIPDATALEGLNAIEDVLMVGYPDGIWDDVHNYPVCRRGITATHP